jgi:hypothetical protein
MQNLTIRLIVARGFNPTICSRLHRRPLPFSERGVDQAVTNSPRKPMRTDFVTTSKRTVILGLHATVAPRDLSIAADLRTHHTMLRQWRHHRPIFA